AWNIGTFLTATEWWVGVHCASKSIRMAASPAVLTRLTTWHLEPRPLKFWFNERKCFDLETWYLRPLMEPWPLYPAPKKYFGSRYPANTSSERTLTTKTKQGL